MRRALLALCRHSLDIPVSGPLPAMTDSHAPNVKLYLLVFAALMVLTVVTVTISYFHLPPAPAILLGLMIATVKAGLVAAFFMHLKGERAIIYGLLGVTAIFTAVLFALPMSDTVATANRRIAPPATAEAPHVP